MAEWSRLIPDGGPREVEAARTAVEELKGRGAETRQALETARRDVVEAEKADRENMARQMREGRDPVSNVKAVAKAREAVEAMQRRAEALKVAIADAEAELGEAVKSSRAQWLKTTQRQERAARERARQALGELETALEERAQSRAVAYWLTQLVEREARFKGGVLGHVTGSETATANGNPIPTGQALAWLRAMLSDPEPATAPVEPTPREPIIA